MRVNQAQYLYLAEWGEPRRETISEAVAAILSTASGPVNLDEIAATVETRVRRHCDRNASTRPRRLIAPPIDNALRAAQSHATLREIK